MLYYIGFNAFVTFLAAIWFYFYGYKPSLKLRTQINYRRADLERLIRESFDYKELYGREPAAYKQQCEVLCNMLTEQYNSYNPSVRGMCADEYVRLIRDINNSQWHWA